MANLPSADQATDVGSLPGMRRTARSPLAQVR